MAYGSLNVDTLTSSTGQIFSPSSSVMKNRIINGAMVIDQRNAGTAYTGVANNQYTLDRWVASVGQSSKMSVQQNAGSVTPPVGFSNYLGITVASAVTPLGSTDYFQIMQKIEGFNTADLQWGTANAKTVTLSFWVYSNLTGTFGGAISNSTQGRNYPFSYTITSANTWQQISITIAGDTTGSWVGATNGIGVWVNFGLGTGTTYSGTAGTWSSNLYANCTGNTNLMASTSNYWYVTGVQLEVGSSATGFEYRPYTTELQLCQRYYQVVGGSGSPICNTSGYSSATTIGNIAFPVTMRTAPTGITTTGTFTLYTAGSGYSVTSVQFDAASIYAIRILGTGSGYPTSNGFDLRTSGTATIGFTGAEL